jgi:hypothetical protein
VAGPRRLQKERVHILAPTIWRARLIPSGFFLEHDSSLVMSKVCAVNE